MDKIKIGENEYAYKFSKAAVIEFERETKKSLVKNADEITLEDMARLCYIAMKHGCKAQNINFTLKFDEFLEADTKYDIIDEMEKTLAELPGK